MTGQRKDSGGDDAESKGLHSYTIYYSPIGFENNYIMRLFVGVEPTVQYWVCDCVDPLRQMCEEKGLMCFPRHDNDDKTVVETWL